MTVSLIVVTIVLFLVLRDAGIMFNKLRYPTLTTATFIAAILFLSYLAESVLRLVFFGE